MKKIFMPVLLLMLAVSSFAQKTINDPNVQKREVTGFHGVAISGSIELFLSQGEESVAVSANDTKWRDQIVTEVKDGILHIHLENDNKFHLDMGTKKLRAYVSVKNIDHLSSSGSGKIHIEEKLKANKLGIEISGSGNIEGPLAVKNLSVSLCGSANTDFTGTADTSEFHISGSGNIRNYDFSTSYCTASISGSGNVKITVTKELSAHISGSGNLLIKGNGMIKDYTASGSGKFKRVE